MQNSYIAKKLDIEDEDLLLMILFWDISSFKSEKGDAAKLSRAGFIYNQKR